MSRIMVNIDIFLVVFNINIIYWIIRNVILAFTLVMILTLKKKNMG